jgi:hypothetical protein
MSKVTEAIKIEMNIPIPEPVRKSGPVKEAAIACPVGGSFVIPHGSIITASRYVKERGLGLVQRKVGEKLVRVWVVAANGNGNGK